MGVWPPLRCVCPLTFAPPPCSGRGVLFVLVVCSAPVAAWSCGSLWRPLLAARVRRPRQVCMPPCPLCPPCSRRGVLFVLVVCSAPVAVWSCESLWRPLFAARVRRPRQVCMPPCPFCSFPRVLGAEFCSSWWCVQLMWLPGAVGVSGVPCWRPAFAVRVRFVCPLIPVVPSPVFWAWSFVPLGSVLNSCGRLELWKSLASPVRRPCSPSASGVYAPLPPLPPPCSGRGVLFVLVVCSAPVAAWSCGSLWCPLFAACVRRLRQVCMLPCPFCSPRVLGVEFCSSWWCVRLLWPPGAVGVSGVPCWPPGFAVRVRCVCAPLSLLFPPPCSGRGVLFLLVVC